MRLCVLDIFIIIRIKFTEKIVTLIRNRIILQSMVNYENLNKTCIVQYILNNSKPMRMPMESMERRICCTCPNSRRKVLPFGAVDRLSKEVRCCSMNEAFSIDRG